MNNGCANNELRTFTKNYKYNPIEYPLDISCPPGYSKIGNQCLTTINKSAITIPESYDELNEDIIKFNANKKELTKDDINKNIQGDNYIVKKCPTKHPENEELLLNTKTSSKTPTKSSCVYDNVQSRDIQKKDTCFQPCDNNYEPIQCGNGDNDSLEKMKKCLENEFGTSDFNPANYTCPPGWKSTGAFTCMQNCKEGYEDNGASMCLEKCKPSYKPLLGSGDPTCSADTYGRGAGRTPELAPCASGERDDGTSCWIDSYGRGTGYNPKPIACPSGMRDDGTSCWEDWKCAGGWNYSWGCGTSIAKCWDGSTGCKDNCYRTWSVLKNCSGCGCIKLTKGDRMQCKPDEEAGINTAAEKRCYPKCKPGYHAVGCCICEPNGGPRITKTRGQRQVCKPDEDTVDLGDLGKVCYPKCKPGYFASTVNICQANGPLTYARNTYMAETKGIKNCELALGAQTFFSKDVVNAFGPLLCATKCKTGYIQDPNNKLLCKKAETIDFCSTERKIDIDSPEKTWIKHCSKENNLTKDNSCLNAMKKNLISTKSINDIYLSKCATKINRTDLIETPNLFTNKKEKNKLLYTFIAQKCFDTNKGNIENPSPNSFYQLDIALPFLADEIIPSILTQSGKIINFDNLPKVFDRYNLIIDPDIITALKNREFEHKLNEELCNDNVKTYKITFIRSRYGSTKEQCCFNLDNMNLDGTGINYYQAINSSDINPTEVNKVNFIRNVFGSKTTCDPKLKRLEGGNDICKSALSDFCTDTNKDGVPRILEFKDKEQTELKHKKCDIDFKKVYPDQYYQLLDEICNNYNPSEQNDFIQSNRICKEYCGSEQEKCKRGMRKYCTQPDKTNSLPLFTEACEKFFAKDEKRDMIMKNFCVSLKGSSIYNDPKCQEFRKNYEKCLVNNIGDSSCDSFYQNNKNITADIMNTKCDKNPNLPFCNKKIIQKDMYNNEYLATPNERETIKNIVSSNPKKYFKTSEEKILATNKETINSGITDEKLKFCLEEKDQTPRCKEYIDTYMSSAFINKCVKGPRDSFERDSICIDIKNSNKTNFNSNIKKYCNDRDSAVYNLAECKKMEIAEREKNNKMYSIFGTIGIIVLMIIIMSIKFFLKSK
jgi:hypothetical protein